MARKSNPEVKLKKLETEVKKLKEKNSKLSEKLTLEVNSNKEKIDLLKESMLSKLEEAQASAYDKAVREFEKYNLLKEKTIIDATTKFEKSWEKDNKKLISSNKKPTKKITAKKIKKVIADKKVEQAVEKATPAKHIKVKSSKPVAPKREKRRLKVKKIVKDQVKEELAEA
jgi:hypothetical protein